MTLSTLPCPSCGAQIRVTLPLGRNPAICPTCGANANLALQHEAPKRGVPLVLIGGIAGGVLLLAVAVFVIVVLMPPSGLLAPGAEWQQYQGPGYQAEFPRQPETGARQTVHVESALRTQVASTTVEGVKFEIAAYEFPVGQELDHNKIVDALALELGTVEHRTGSSVGGLPGTLARLDQGSYLGALVAIASIDERGYVVLCSGFTPKGRQAAERFIDSFRITMLERDEPAPVADTAIEPLTINLKRELEADPEAGFEVEAGESFDVEYEAVGGVAPYRVYVQGRVPRGLRPAIGVNGIRFVGRPTDVGRHELEVHIEDSAGGHAVERMVLSVTGIEASSSWGEVNLPDARQGQAYTGRIGLDSTPAPRSVQWSGQFEKIPPGIRFSGDERGAALSGEPIQWGSYAFELSVRVEFAGAAPVMLSRSFQITVLPERPQLAPHVLGQVLIIAHPGAFTEENEVTMLGQAEAMINRFVPTQKANLWIIEPEGLQQTLPDDQPAESGEQLVQALLQNLALRSSQPSALAAGLAQAATKNLQGYETILILTAWNPENPGSDQPGQVAAQLSALAKEGRRVVLAMQSSRDMSAQKTLPSEDDLIYLRYLTE
jgi:hypothetical protein